MSPRGSSVNVMSVPRSGAALTAPGGSRQITTKEVY